MTKVPEIPDWFWNLIETTKPKLALLVGRLEALGQTDLEHWQKAYEDAAEAIVPYWDGPDIGGEVGTLSEDDTEEFCKWVVSQGRGLWQRATAPDADLKLLARLYWSAENGMVIDYPPWSDAVTKAEYRGYHDPSCIAYPIYRARFGKDLET